LTKYLFFSAPPNPAGPESLLGIKIGDSELPAKLELKQPRVLDPWATGTPPNYLAHVLREQDLGLTQEERKRLTVQKTADNRLVVLFYDDKVRAVVVHEPHTGQAARGVGVGDRVDILDQRYKEDPSAVDAVKMGDDAAEFPKGQVVLSRYEPLGLTFMVQSHRVIAIALYPAKP
jgi:hypothetical protein